MTEKELQELCDSTCNCGYVLPKPEWIHPARCGFSVARKRLVGDGCEVCNPELAKEFQEEKP